MKGTIKGKRRNESSNCKKKRIKTKKLQNIFFFCFNYEFNIG